ncbi:unnamed protein product [Rangifer tarandus platyrhynchus]|uniref:Uncharacterized protein n=2 Tax=Rangifer tarandus platyrhynchus TaxID=3082113 RepID=A0ACB0F506_RANTA|nr:unnamed protein product [Rangifer tarandus platyrhynchus]CAI9707384.1 unnamed protein product [Rangifer tarandus platyrhynchus]
MATDISPRNPDQEQRNCNPGWAHLPCWSRASTGPRRHGRRGLGVAGASGPVSELRDLPPQRCPQTGIRPFPPPATSALASQPRLHPAARAPTLLLGRCAGPSSPGRLRAPPPLPPPPPLRMKKQTPCFCFEFPTPPRGRGT